MERENKTEARREGLQEQKLGLAIVEVHRAEKAFGFLEREVWPHLPESIMGKPISKEEREEILGFGSDGV